MEENKLGSSPVKSVFETEIGDNHLEAKFNFEELCNLIETYHPSLPRDAQNKAFELLIKIKEYFNEPS